MNASLYQPAWVDISIVLLGFCLFIYSINDFLLSLTSNLSPIPSNSPFKSSPEPLNIAIGIHH
ncbi:hypothetical protein BMETH_2369_1 [methanotrophic bacterial endosymbiont of Bathymodiolus sp.]|nr:hypothetical protein BMETH_2369_1 [methanotrophic bacterial endosymbiont of Bathymodiolus sp.]